MRRGLVAADATVKRNPNLAVPLIGMQAAHAPTFTRPSAPHFCWRRDSSITALAVCLADRNPFRDRARPLHDADRIAARNSSLACFQMRKCESVDATSRTLHSTAAVGSNSARRRPESNDSLSACRPGYPEGRRSSHDRRRSLCSTGRPGRGAPVARQPLITTVVACVAFEL
jgi:hypothetical protein